MLTKSTTQTTADNYIGTNSETVNLLTSNIYLLLLTLENCKKTYAILERKKKHLKKMDNSTESGARKRQAIPLLEAKQNELKAIFNSLVPIVENWVANFAPENKIFGDAIITHYCNFEKNPESLQIDLDLLGLCMTASNFRAKIQQIWLDEFNK